MLRFGLTTKYRQFFPAATAALLLATTATARERSASFFPQVTGDCPAWSTRHVEITHGSDKDISRVTCTDFKNRPLKTALISISNGARHRQADELVYATERATFDGPLSRFYENFLTRAPDEIKPFLRKARAHHDLEFRWDAHERRLTVSAPALNTNESPYNHTVAFSQDGSYESHGFGYEGFGFTRKSATNGLTFSLQSQFKNPDGRGGQTVIEKCGTPQNQFLMTIESAPDRKAPRARLVFEGVRIFETDLPGFDIGADNILDFLTAFKRNPFAAAWATCHRYADQTIKRPEWPFFDPEPSEIAKNIAALAQSPTTFLNDEKQDSAPRAAKKSKPASQSRTKAAVVNQSPSQEAR